MQLAAFGRKPSHCDGSSSTARGGQHVELIDAQMIHEFEQVLGVAGQRTRQRRASLRKAAARQINRVYRITACQSLNDEAPGERVSRYAVYQQQSRAPAGA